jgi:hypothetical protein
MAYSLFFRTESYDADFEQDRNGWSWWLKRISISNLNIIFKDEVLLFDYPLVLNKTWGGHTIALLNVGKMQIPMRFDYEGKITRYISEYEVPIELGLSADLEKAEAKFINASQLHTPDKNVYAPGILVTELELKPLGWMPIKAEFYKDVREGPCLICFL